MAYAERRASEAGFSAGVGGHPQGERGIPLLLPASDVVYSVPAGAAGAAVADPGGNPDASGRLSGEPDSVSGADPGAAGNADCVPPAREKLLFCGREASFAGGAKEKAEGMGGLDRGDAEVGRETRRWEYRPGA